MSFTTLGQGGLILQLPIKPTWGVVVAESQVLLLRRNQSDLVPACDDDMLRLILAGVGSHKRVTFDARVTIGSKQPVVLFHAHWLATFTRSGPVHRQHPPAQRNTLHVIHKRSLKNDGSVRECK